MAAGELSLYSQCAWTDAWPLVSTPRMFINCPTEYPSTGKGRLVDWLCLGQQKLLKGDYYSTTARVQPLTIDSDIPIDPGDMALLNRPPSDCVLVHCTRTCLYPLREFLNFFQWIGSIKGAWLGWQLSIQDPFVGVFPIAMILVI